MQNYKTSRITCKRKKSQFLEFDDDSLDIIKSMISKRKKKSAVKYEDLIHIVFLVNMHNNFWSCQWCDIVKAFFLALNCLIANSK